MRTTIDIHDPLLERAKSLAARTDRRLADVVNDALAEMLNRQESAEGRPGIRIELPTYGGSGAAKGTLPGIDPRSNASYFEAIDEEHRDVDNGKIDVAKLR